MAENISLAWTPFRMRNMRHEHATYAYRPSTHGRRDRGPTIRL